MYKYFCYSYFRNRNSDFEKGSKIVKSANKAVPRKRDSLLFTPFQFMQYFIEQMKKLLILVLHLVKSLRKLNHTYFIFLVYSMLTKLSHGVTAFIAVTLILLLGQGALLSTTHAQPSYEDDYYYDDYEYDYSYPDEYDYDYDSYDYDDYYYSDYSSGGEEAGAAFLIALVCGLCLSLLIIGGIGFFVYKDAQKVGVENPILWAVLSALLGLLGILLYIFIARKNATDGATPKKQEAPSEPTKSA